MSTAPSKLPGYASGRNYVNFITSTVDSGWTNHQDTVGVETAPSARISN